MTAHATKTTRKLMKLADAYSHERADGREWKNTERIAAARTKLREEVSAALRAAYQAGRESSL